MDLGPKLIRHGESKLSGSQLEEFNGEVPSYAILSHTWGDDEVSFKDVTKRADIEKMKGFQKIRFTCEQALRDKIGYVWCDTCCIDKSSSAELSEAINSMWSYYRKAKVCYVYMEDVSAKPDADHKALNSEIQREFENSNWFKRAWTLQELIAPRSLIFYNGDGSQIGVRTGALLPLIHQITRIPENILRSGGAPLEQKLSRCSIAQRMSWAAQRQSTRVEDRAYSLLGLFDINMPMLYGEGRKAFVRLQEEIIKTSTDHSILVHGFLGHLERNTLFALTPEAFIGGDDIEACAPNEPTEPFFMTNRGLQITLPVIQEIPSELYPSRVVVALNCRRPRGAITVTLEQLNETPRAAGLPGEFRRASSDKNWVSVVDSAPSENKRLIVIVRRGEIYSTGADYQSKSPNRSIPTGLLRPDGR